MTRVTSASDDDDDDGSFDLDVKMTFGYYTSFDSDETHHSNSGAYLFRPRTPDERLRAFIPDPTKSWAFRSDLVTEVHVGFDVPWMKQITRLRKGQPYVEVEYTVGPIPIDDGVGKEIVARYDSGIQSRGVLYTDSNGREFVQRKRGYRPTWELKEYEPVAGNYYPVNAAAYVEDEDKDDDDDDDDDHRASMAVLVDRSQGGASLSDGSIELMIQRRVLADDGRGVGEPLNETVGGVTPYPPYGDASRRGEGIVVKGVHRILVGEGGSGARLARSLMDRTWSPPHVFAASSVAASSDNVLFKRPGFSAFGGDLPENVMVITHSLVEKMGSVMTFLVRFAHQYAKGEDERLSKPARIDLNKFYGDDFVRVSIAEKTLSGNQDYDQWAKRRLRWKKGGGGVLPTAAAGDDEWIVELNPMEIKTYLIELSAV
uniref:Glycosyl hydrolase family 38 C-terminal domain-containing protein n=1 Tax=Odontella aurita TaxID=265563 RepID=A0A7S4N8T3_9STRA|mmetsp:Transcript_52228/g.156768  ORF Transcript_52228/g.156768 Transcript_52228/m.156768 type:complete len:429 (+) Transcript_52228:2-1288(+)